jgi:hypothetical protein
MQATNRKTRLERTYAKLIGWLSATNFLPSLYLMHPLLYILMIPHSVAFADTAARADISNLYSWNPATKATLVTVK